MTQKDLVDLPTKHRIDLMQKHLGPNRYDQKILVTDDGEWISNGHWLLRTNRLRVEDFVKGHDAIKCWASGRLVSPGKMHLVSYPSLAGKAIEELHPKGKLTPFRRAGIYYGDSHNTAHPIFLGLDGTPFMINRVYDDLFGEKSWWGSPEGAVGVGANRQHIGSVCDDIDPKKATVFLMPLRMGDAEMTRHGFSIQPIRKDQKAAS